jgi:arylsulfatase
MKPVLARQMEVYAGFFEFTDHHVGRLIDALEQLQVLDDTLIFFIIVITEHRVKERCRAPLMKCFPSMASLRSRPQPSWPLASTNSAAPSPITTMRSDGRMRWTPYQWTKQVASHWGGTRNGTIIHWPKGIRAQGEIRHQFHHVIDIAPTVMETAQLPEPYKVNGVAQVPMQGVSMVPRRVF